MEAKAKQKAVIYSRVSTNLQDTKSQLEELNKYAEYANIQVLKSYEEQAVSGKTKAESRPKFKEMLSFIRSEGVELVLTTELSRLGRSSIDIQQVIEKLKNEGVGVYIQNLNINTFDGSAGSRIIVSTLSTMAELEREQIVDRTSRGKRSAVRNGRSFGKISLGYDTNENKELVINEKEAETVRAVYETYLRVGKFITTCHIVNEAGHLTKQGKPFDLKQLKRLLENPKYKGEFYVTFTEKNSKGEVISTEQIKTECPAIVSVETWEQVSKMMGESEGQRNKRKNSNPLGLGVGKCAVCGAPLHYQTSATTPIYVCRSSILHRQTKQGNQCLAVSANMVNNVLIDIIKRVQAQGVAAITGGQLDELEANIAEIQIKKDEVKAKIKKSQDRVKNATKLAIDGDISQAELREVKDQAKQAQKLLAGDSEKFDDQLSELYERKQLLTSPDQSTEYITTSLAGLEDYCRGLKIDIEELPTDHSLSEKFFQYSLQIPAKVCTRTDLNCAASPV